MKKKALKLLGLATLTGLGAIQTVTAQAPLMKVQIPFAFRATNAQLPAGDYTVRITSNDGSKIYLLQNFAAKRAILLVGTNRFDRLGAGHPRLVFECTAGACSLAELWMGNTAGTQVPVRHRVAQSEEPTVAKVIPLNR